MTTLGATPYTASFDAAGFALLQKELKRQGAMIIALQQVMINRGMSREALAEALGVDVAKVPVSNIAKKTAAVATTATVSTDSRLPQTEGVTSGLYFNAKTGDAVIVNKEGAAFRLDLDDNGKGVTTPLADFDGVGFDWKAKNGLVPVLAKMVAELRGTASAAPRARATQPARVAEVKAAAAPIRIGNTTTMSDAQVANTIRDLGVDYDTIIDGYKGAARAQAARYWLHVAKGAIKGGASLKKASAAAFAALAE